MVPCSKPSSTQDLIDHSCSWGHENKTQETDSSWKAVWSKLIRWKREFEIKKAAHYSFLGLPLVTEVLVCKGTYHSKSSGFWAPSRVTE
jgi:hypothetical protein